MCSGDVSLAAVVIDERRRREARKIVCPRQKKLLLTLLILLSLSLAPAHLISQPPSTAKTSSAKLAAMRFVGELLRMPPLHAGNIQGSRKCVLLSEDFCNFVKIDNVFRMIYFVFCNSTMNFVWQRVLLFVALSSLLVTTEKKKKQTKSTTRDFECDFNFSLRSL